MHVPCPCLIYVWEAELIAIDEVIHSYVLWSQILYLAEHSVTLQPEEESTVIKAPDFLRYVATENSKRDSSGHVKDEQLTWLQGYLSSTQICSKKKDAESYLQNAQCSKV